MSKILTASRKSRENTSQRKGILKTKYDYHDKNDIRGGKIGGDKTHECRRHDQPEYSNYKENKGLKQDLQPSLFRAKVKITITSSKRKKSTLGLISTV
jgi:hypothetical protein